MSDNSDSELPLPPRDRDSDSDDSDSSSSSSSSSVRTNDIPIPDEDPELSHHNGGQEILAEIPIPDETDREHDLELADSEIDIPLPPDSSKYSPSQATPEDDMGISSSMESKKPGPKVLGTAQAKKRLLAFSAAKLATTSPIAGAAVKKVTPSKASVVQKQSKQEQQLAIETIKQEETKMKEILAMNSILHQKLRQVNVITNLPTTPPVTAIVKPTVIAPSPVPALPSLLDIKVSPSALRSVQTEKVVKSPDRSRKSTKHIRKAHRSSSHSSRSHSRSSSSRSRSPSAERKSSKRGRKSRSRSRDRKDKEKDRRDREADKKENRGRGSGRKSRSKSKERGKHRRSHSRSKSKSKERDSERRKKSRSKSMERDRESERQRHREKESRRSRKSKSRSRDRDKKRSTRKGSPEDERDAAGQERDRARGNEKEKSKSDRSRRDEEREKRAEEEKQYYEHERELDKVRLARFPVDWADYHEHQYRHGDLRTVRRKLGSEAINRSRSQSGSPSPSRPADGVPLSKGSTFDVSTISINSVSDIKIDYPSFLLQKTKIKPCLEFGYTPLCSKGYYKTREQIFSEEDGYIVDAMKEIINSKPTAKDSTVKTEAREWFSPTAQAFCPAVVGKQAVLISHLYSDEERDESPAPALHTTKSGKPTKKDKRPPQSSSPHEESMDEDDSMDSAPSPLLKRKYETPPSPPRPKKKSKRSPPPSESEEEIPLRKDTLAVERERETAKEKSKSKKRGDEVQEKKYEGVKEKQRERDEVKEKRRDDKEDDHKEKKRAEKDKKRLEKEKKREGKEKARNEEKEKRSGESEKDKEKKRDEKRKKRDDDEEEKNDIEKHSKRDEEKAKKSKKQVEKEKEEAPVKEKHSKSKDAKEEVPEKTKKKKRDKEKKAKKKHKKRQESSSSEPSPSPSPSSSSSSEESSASEDESDHKGKSKHKKLKKKKKTKGKKEKPKPTSRGKSPESSSDEKGGKDRDGGGGSHSKGGSSRKDSHSKSRHDSRDRDRSRRERSRERERDRRSSNYGRRRTGDADDVDGEEWEEEMLTSPSDIFPGSEMETDALMHNMNPPNPLSGANLQLLDAEIDSILDSSKQATANANLSPDPENTTHELLSVFDDDALLQSVLQNENISAEKLLMNISGPDADNGEPSTSLISQKPFVSWSDDSEEEEFKRTNERAEEEQDPESEAPTGKVPSEPITPTSLASTSGYETEVKSEAAAEDPGVSEREREPSEKSSRSRTRSRSRSPEDHRDRDRDRDRERDRHHREYDRRDYYDSRSRLMHAHVYDRRGGRRGSFHDRYSTRDRDHDQRYGGGRYYPDRHRASESSHSHRYRDERDRDRRSHSPDRDRDRDRRRRRYDDEDDHDRDRYGGRFEKPKEIKSDSREPGTVKTESPPVPDSTISDSELQSGNSLQLVPAAEGPCVEYADPSYYYNQAMNGMPMIAGQEFHGEMINDGGQGFGSPKRLSLDERLEIEIGLDRSQFLPIPRSEAQAPVTQIPILHMNRLHSQINLMGSVIQVIPIDIPTAPIVIRSTYPAVTQFDIYGNPIGGPGQYPPRRVITIKVPIVPFTVPVMDPEAVIVKEPKIRRKRSSKHEKQKRKLSKIELERAKRKKGAEAKLQRRSKHRDRDSESHDRQKVAKEVKATVETEAEAPPTEKVKPEPETKETENITEKGENTKATTPTSELTPAPASESPVPEPMQTQDEADVTVTVKQEIVQEECSIKTESEETTATVMPAEETETITVLVPERPPIVKKIEILPPPERGILVLLGFRERSQEERKKVKFADGIDPGCGTSSSGGEELASPPPSFGKDPVIEAQLKKKTKRKKKKKKLHGEQTDLFAPPSCPQMSYPFCPPGILYQVCPQYALLYAQAMAEKGLDVVFDPTEEVPYGDKQDPTIPVLQSQNSDAASSVNGPLAQPEVPSTPNPAPVSLPPGIDFSKPPPSTFGTHNYEFATPPPMNYSPYENSREPVANSYSGASSNFRRGQYSESFHTPPESGSKIPTIVNHQPIKVLSPRTSKPPSSYVKESPIAVIGQSIQVVTRAAPNPTYPLHEERHHNHYNHVYESAPPLISPHLEEVKPPAFEYRGSNVLIPLHEEPVAPSHALPAPTAVIAPSVREPSTKKASKKSTGSKSGSGDIGISIPLSKIVSNSSIPSLAQNSSHYGNNSSRKPVPSQASPSHRNAYSSYTSFDFTPYHSTTQSTNSNLISVKPQPNLYEVPITLTETLSLKPKIEASLDLNAVPTSTTSTPSSISPVKSNDAMPLSSSPGSAFSA